MHLRKHGPDQRHTRADRSVNASLAALPLISPHLGLISEFGLAYCRMATPECVVVVGSIMVPGFEVDMIRSFPWHSSQYSGSSPDPDALFI
jgi:hypothetical protein